MKTKAQFCGEFYSDSTDAAKLIGHVFKIGTQFVIRGIADFSGKILWESAPFTGHEFKKVRTLNLGYAKVNYYTAK